MKGMEGGGEHLTFTLRLRMNLFTVWCRALLCLVFHNKTKNAVPSWGNCAKLQNSSLCGATMARFGTATAWQCHRARRAQEAVGS